MSLKNIYPEKIPKEMLEMNYIDDIILYSLGAYGPLQKAEFNKINKTTFYKYLNSLIEKGFLFPPKRKRKIAIYEITPSGQAELIRRLGKYNFDFYELIELEKKKILAQVSQLSSFFEKYNINDDQIKIDFLYLYNNLIRDESLSIFSEEQFNILIFYIILNDVKFFKEVDNVLTIKEFIDKIEFEISLTKTDVMMFIQEVVDKNRYRTNIFKIPITKENAFLFFCEDSEIGIIFETIIKKHLRNLNYLKSLNNSEIYLSDLEDIMKPIMYDLTKKYKIFNKEMEKEIFHLVEEYITDLQIELHQKPFIEIDKIGEYFSLYSPYVGFTYPFKPLSEEDELELKDIRITFQRIREKEPKNKLLSKASDFLYENKLEEALIEVNNCLEIDSKDSETLELKSRILFDKGNFKRALEIFDDAQTNKIEDENTYDKLSTKFYRTELLLALKRYKEATDTIKKDIPSILKDDKEFNEVEFFRDNYLEFQLHKLEATIYYEQGKYKNALEAIIKDIDFVKNFVGMDEDERIADSYILKAKIVKKLDKSDNVFDILKNALKLNINNPGLLFEIAELIFLFNPIESSLALIKALKFKPNDGKIEKLLDMIEGVPHVKLYSFESHFHISEEISKILGNQKRGMTLLELSQKLQDSGVTKSFEKFLDEENSETTIFIIKRVEKSKAIEFIDGVYVLNSEGMRDYLRETKLLRQAILIENFYMNLLIAYKSNDWKDFTKENLISKLIVNMTGDQLVKIASSLIDSLLEKKFLIETKKNLISIDINKFLEHFSQVKDEITTEEVKKFL